MGSRTRGLSSCGMQAQVLCGMLNPPRLGLEPTSPALAGSFLTSGQQESPDRMISFSPSLGEPSFGIQLVTQPPQASVATGSSHQILFSLAMLPVDHSGLTDFCFTCNSNSHVYLISQSTARWKPKLGRRKNIGRKSTL